MKKSIKTIGSIFAITVASLAIGQDEKKEHKSTELIAILNPTAESTAKGVVTFRQVGTGVEIQAVVSGLNPGQEHGFHIHEFGDASDAAGKSAGGHFNPEGHDHALPSGEKEPAEVTDGKMKKGHVGDLGNLLADDKGVATKTIIVPGIHLTHGEHSILGRGMIVHAKPDDGGQPTGNAGARIAIGVIGFRNPEFEPFITLKDVMPDYESYVLVLREKSAAEKVGEALENAGEEAAEGVEKVLRETGNALERLGKKLTD